MRIEEAKPTRVARVRRNGTPEKCESASSRKGSVVMRVLRNLVMVLLLGTLTISCRSLGPAGPLLADIAVTAVVTAVAVAAWYSIANSVVVYPTPGVYRGYYRLPPGAQIYVLAYSADGQWVQIQTPDGRVGWVPRNQLGNVQPMY